MPWVASVSLLCLSCHVMLHPLCALVKKALLLQADQSAPGKRVHWRHHPLPSPPPILRLYARPLVAPRDPYPLELGLHLANHVPQLSRLPLAPDEPRVEERRARRARADTQEDPQPVERTEGLEGRGDDEGEGGDDARGEEAHLEARGGQRGAVRCVEGRQRGGEKLRLQRVGGEDLLSLRCVGTKANVASTAKWSEYETPRDGTGSVSVTSHRSGESCHGASTGERYRK